MPQRPQPPAPSIWDEIEQDLATPTPTAASVWDEIERDLATPEAPTGPIAARGTTDPTSVRVTTPGRDVLLPPEPLPVQPRAPMPLARAHQDTRPAVLPAAYRPVPAHEPAVDPARQALDDTLATVHPERQPAHVPTMPELRQPRPEVPAARAPVALEAPVEFVKTAVGGLVGSAAEGVTATAAWAGLASPETLQRVQENVRTMAPAVTESVLDNPAATLGNPLWWAGVGGQVTGSILSLAGAGGAGMAGMSKAAQVLNLSAKAKAALVPIAGAASASVAESWLEASLHYSEAIERGATPEEAGSAAAKVFAANIPLTALGTGVLFNPQSKRAAVNALINVFSEGGQEAAQQVASNIAAQGYDPNQGTFEHVADAGIIGAIAGPAAGHMIQRTGDALSALQAPHTDPSRVQVPPPVTPAAARPGDSAEAVAPGTAAPASPPVAPATVLPVSSRLETAQPVSPPSDVWQAVEQEVASTPAELPDPDTEGAPAPPVGTELLVDESGRELGGYAGPERRADTRVATEDEDRLYQEYRDRLARGEDVVSPAARKAFEQRQALDSSREQAAIDEVRQAEPQADVWGDVEEAVKPPREFSSTQVDLPPADADALRSLAARIPDEDLAEDGREDKPHVTVKYGLHTADVEDVRKVLAGEPPITVRMGKTSFFPPSDSSGGADVLKVDIDSPDLHRLNAKIAKALEHTDSFPDYKPHATIAYVKRGLGEKYAGDASLEGRTIQVNSITFSGKNRDVIEIPLGGGSAAEAAPARTPLDEAIHAATHSHTGADERWAKLRERGATDEEILAVLGDEFGISGGSSLPGGGYQSHKGGKAPRLDFHPVGLGALGVSDKLQGKKLAREVRRVLGIPGPPSSEKETSPEDKKPSAPVTPKAEDKPDVKGEVKGRDNPNVRHNAERGSVEVKFAKKPAPEVIARLKSWGYRWAKGNQHWYKKVKTEEVEREIREVNDALGVESPPAKPAPSVTPKDDPRVQDMATAADGHVYQVGERVTLVDGNDQRIYTIRAIHPEGIRVEYEPGKGRAVTPAQIQRATDEERFDAAARGVAYEDMTDAELRELLDIGVGDEPQKAAVELARRQKPSAPVTAKVRGAAANYRVGDSVGVEGRAATVTEIVGEDVRVQFEDGSIVLHHGSRLTPPPRNAAPPKPAPPVTPKADAITHGDRGVDAKGVWTVTALNLEQDRVVISLPRRLTGGKDNARAVTSAQFLEMRRAWEASRSNETLPVAPKEPTEDAEAASSGRLAVKLYAVFSENPDRIPKDPRELRKLAAQITGKTEQEIADNIDELNDAVEAALAHQVAPSVPAMGVSLAAAVADAQAIEDKLPRAHRSLEKTKLQQFSTPLPIAVLAAHAAQPRKGDRVLEPTAGTGNLIAAIMPKNEGGAEILAVELSQRRARLLRAQGYNVIHEGDYLVAKVDPVDVIVSNPPWGKYSTGKYGRGIGLEFSPIDVAERFVAKMLRDLTPGGRLVAVMPTTMLESQAFKKWLRDTHFVRAIIKSPPKAYDTRATSVESVLLVIDKVAPPVKGGPLPRVIDAQDWQAYVAAVEAIGERPQATRRPVADAAGAAPEPRPGRPAGGRVQSGGAESGRNPTVGTGRPADVVAAGPSGGGRAAVDAGGAPDRPAPEPPRAPAARVSGPTDDTRRAAAASSFFAPYVRRTQVGGQPHPKLLVEAKQLAGVPYPPITQKPTPSMQAAIDAGRISVEQAEQALAVLQANSGEKPFGYLAADAVGVGKSREIALTILGAMDRAKAEKRPLRLMLTTKSRDNVEDLLDEIHFVASGKPSGAGGSVPFEVYRISDDYPGAKKAGNDYEPLPKAEHAVYVVDSYNVAPYRQALADVELHGIVGDEVQRFTNQDAQIGGAWLNLHARVMRNVARPQQFFAYFTATPAQKIEDYRYLYGLRLWPIDGFHEWLNLVTGGMDEKAAKKLAEDTERGSTKPLDQLVSETGADPVGGDADSDGKKDNKPKKSWGTYASNVFAQRLTPAEAEQIPREWKMLGRFSARDLWRAGTTFEIHQAELPAAHRQKYDQFVDLALDIMRAAHKYGLYDKSGKASRFGVTGALQFAAKRIQMQPALEEAVKLAKDYAKQGYQPVLSIINVTEMSEQRGHLVAAIEKINTRMVDEDPSDPDAGLQDLGEIPEAVVDRARLMDRVRDLGSFSDPVEYIAEELGKEKVAFIIGKEKASRRKASGEFQSGQRTYAVISGAGSTGINLDQRKRTDVGPGNGRRVFLDVQYEWSAMEAVQRYGRVDRASSIAPPKIVAITFGNASEKKFLATIANRMAALGALSKGGAESTGAAGSALEEFEITGDDALAAARRAYAEADEDTKRSFATVKSAFRDPNRNGKAPDQPDFDPFKPSPDAHGVQMIDFQLPLLLMPVDQANAFWEKFIQYRDELRLESGERDTMRSTRFTGEVLETHNLKENLKLYAVKNEQNQKFGILVGLITPEMPRLRNLLRGSREQDGETATGLRTADIQVRRQYVTFSAGDEILTGLRIPITRVPTVASSYGASATGPNLDTADAVLAYLKAGETITLAVQNPDSGKPWVLRYRPSDARIAIDNARMQDRNQLLNHGADYVPVGNYWRVKDLDKFLERWPVPDQAKEASGGGVSQSPILGPSQPLPPRPPQGHKAPVPVTDKMRPSEIVRKLREGLGGIPVSVGRFRQRAWGIYKDKPQAVRVRVSNDLQTIAHEFGHHVDHAVLNIDRTDKRWRDELEHLGQATSRPSYTKQQIRQEGAAEFFRMYLMEPDTAKHEAPEYFAEFERKLEQHREVKKLLHESRADLQGLIAQDHATRGRLKIDRTGKEPPQSVLKLLAQDPKAGVAEMARRWQTNLYWLKAAVEEMKDGRPLPYKDHAWVLAEAAQRAASKAESFLYHSGVVGKDGRFIATTFANAIAPVKDRWNDLGDYLVALRAVEVIRMKGKNPGLTLEEAEGIIREIERDPRAADFAQARDNVYRYLAGLRQYMLEFGVLSDELDQKLAKEIFYVPLHRVVDTIGGDGRPGQARTLANRSTPVKRMKGSGADIIDPLETIIKNTFSIVDAVEKNAPMAALARQARQSAGSAKWLEEVPQPQIATRFNLSQVESRVRDELEAAGVELPANFELDELVTVFTPAQLVMQGKNLITAIENGERRWWEVHHQGLYDAITALGPTVTGEVVRFATKVAAVLRAGATGTPGFIVKNVVRDPLVAFMQSRTGQIPWVDSTRAMVSLLLGDEDAKLFFSRGLKQSTLAGADREAARDALQRMKVTTRAEFFKHVVQHPIQLLQLMSTYGEASTRLAEFRLMVGSGGKERRPGVLGVVQRFTDRGQRSTDEETLTKAAFAASEVTTNFQRGGSTAKEISRYKAFFNAREQGYVRIGETIARDPLAFGINVALVGLVSYALWMLNYDDDEYQEIPAWEKNTYWHIPAEVLEVMGLRASGFIKIPKPFEWGAMGNIVEAALEYTRTHNPGALARINQQVPLARSLSEAVATLTPTMLLPMSEAAFNYDSFRDTHIVKPWDVGINSQLQFNDWTTQTARVIGKHLPIAPAKIDHLIFGYTAGFGRGVEEYGFDPALRALGLAPKNIAPEKPLRRQPLIGTFFRDSGFDGGAESLTEFYAAYNGIMDLEKSLKRTKDDEQRREFRMDARSKSWFPKDGRLDAAKMRYSAAKELLELKGKEIDAIYAAPPAKMSPAEKRQRLDRVYEGMVGIARRALGKPPLRRGHDEPGTERSTGR